VEDLLSKSAIMGGLRWVLLGSVSCIVTALIYLQCSNNNNKKKIIAKYGGRMSLRSRGIKVPDKRDMELAITQPNLSQMRCLL
jgi:hypothetical protein